MKILLDKPRELLTFILIGNTIVNIAIGSIAAHYTLNVIANNLTMVNQEKLLFIEIIIITLIILIFGEILPKTFAMKRSIEFSNFMSGRIKLLLTICKPIFFVFYKISDLIIKINPFQKSLNRLHNIKIIIL